MKTVLAFFSYQRLICIHSFTGKLSFNACGFSCWQVLLFPSVSMPSIASLRHQSTQDILLTLRKLSQLWWQYGKVPSSSRGSCELSMCLWRDFMEVRSSNCTGTERKTKKLTCIRVWVLEEEGKVNKRQNLLLLYLSCAEAQHAVCSCNISTIWMEKNPNNSILEQLVEQLSGQALKECRPQHAILPGRTSVMEVWQQPAFSRASISWCKQSNSLVCSHSCAVICICLENLGG